MLDDEHHFPQPTGGRKNGLSRGLDAGVRICDTGHGSSLTWEYSHSSLVRRHIFPRPRYFLATRCAIRGTSGEAASSVSVAAPCSIFLTDTPMLAVADCPGPTGTCSRYRPR